MAGLQTLLDICRNRRVAFIFSLVSLAGVFGLIYCVWQTGVELKQIHTYNLLIQSLNIGAAEQSSAAVADLLFSKTYQPQSADQATPFSSRSALTDTIFELHAIIIALKQGDSQKSLVKFNALLDGRLQGLLYAQGASHYSVQLIKELAEQFKSYHQNVAHLRQEEERIPRLIESNRRIMKQHDEASRSLAMDFGNLFVLPPVLEADADGLSVSYYQSGVLQNLPRLNGLPDGLPDLLALKETLAKAGGQVQLRGADMAKRFQQELGRFRKELETSRKKIAALQKENSIAERELQRKQIAAYHAAQGLLQRLTSLLLESLKPTTSRSTVFISTYFNLASQ